MALDMKLASQGRLCTVVNTVHCVYVVQSGGISTDIKKICKHPRIFHEFPKVHTFYGIQDIWNTLTSWFPDLQLWVKKSISRCLSPLPL